MCRIFPIHDTSKRQSTLAEVFVGDRSELGVGTGSNAVAGPVVGRLGGAYELTRRFDICKASADRSPRADTLAATDRRVCANQSPASGLIWAESPASPRQVERTCAACRSITGTCDRLHLAKVSFALPIPSLPIGTVGASRCVVDCSHVERASYRRGKATGRHRVPRPRCPAERDGVLLASLVGPDVLLHEAPICTSRWA